MMILLWNPPPSDDRDASYYFAVLALTMAAVVIAGQLVRWLT